MNYQQRRLSVQRQVPIAIRCKEMTFDEAFRADIFVEKKVIVELKSVEQISETHKKASSDLFAINWVQTRFPAELWRGVNETRRHHPRREWFEG